MTCYDLNMLKYPIYKIKLCTVVPETKDALISKNIKVITRVCHFFYDRK